jgi:GT2 family glycosyltransferase
MISIIVCSINPDRFKRVCDTYSRVFGTEDTELIAVHDALSLAEAYNRAVPACKGDLIIFSHDDIQILNADFKERLLGHMEHADMVGIAGSTHVTGGAWAQPAYPYIYGQIAHYSPAEKLYFAGVWGVPQRRVDGIKAMDGVFLCTRRNLAREIPFDEKAFTGFHGYDMDFTFRAHLAGFRLAVGCDLCILHESSGQWDNSWKRYEDIFRLKHFGRFDVLAPRIYKAATVSVESSDELLRIMTPPWWDH